MQKVFQKKWVRWTVKQVLKLLGALVLLFVLLVSSIYLGLFGGLPDEEALRRISGAESSIILDSGGTQIGKFFRFDRVKVEFDQVPSDVINALIATEDVRFFEHSGIDHKSLARVLVKTIMLQKRSAGGGSTLTQQLAKNLYPREQFKKFDLLVAKIKESIIAIRLEKMYSKNEIIALYLNTVSFPDNTFGIESAARCFFGKSVTQLSISEAATLIGSLKANYGYNPRIFPQRSFARRNVVLSQMHKYGFISSEQLGHLTREAVILNYQGVKGYNIAPFFREKVRRELHLLKAQGLFDADIYADGLVIHTTLDNQMQDMAEKELVKHMALLQTQFERNWGDQALWKDKDWRFELIVQSQAYLNWIERGMSKAEALDRMKLKYDMSWYDAGAYKDVHACQIDSLMHYVKLLNAGSITIDGHSGAVKTWIGGIDFQSVKYDHVDQSKRQVGSVFKPFVYASAIEAGFQPCSYFSVDPISFSNYADWKPTNDSNEFDGKMVSMQTALSKSLNTVAVRVLEQTGIDLVIETAKAAGIRSTLPKVPSLALGTPELSLYEIAAAYTIFCNKGIPTTPYIIEFIENAKGEVIYQHKDTEQDRVISPYTYAMMLEMLQGVTSSGGTASRIRWKYGMTSDIAGKTGTTQQNRDGWFVAITPDLVSVNWVGLDRYDLHFKDTNVGQGANTALPIFAGFYNRLKQSSTRRELLTKSFPDVPEEWQGDLSCDGVQDKGVLQKIFRKERSTRDFEEPDSLEDNGVVEKMKRLFKKRK